MRETEAHGKADEYVGIECESASGVGLVNDKYWVKGTTTPSCDNYWRACQDGPKIKKLFIWG